MGRLSGSVNVFFTARRAKSTANHLSKIPAKSETPTPIIEKVMNFYQYLVFVFKNKTNLVLYRTSPFNVFRFLAYILFPSEGISMGFLHAIPPALLFPRVRVSNSYDS